MNTAKESSDDFFIGDFTESEKVIAAKHILKKQDCLRKKFAASTAVSVLFILYVGGLIIGFIASFPELAEECLDPGYIPHGRLHLSGKGNLILSAAYIPIMVSFIVILAAGISTEYKKMSAYNSYKVYKGIISRIEKNYSFTKIPLYSIGIMFDGEKELAFDYVISDREASEYAEGTEIILIDFVKLGKGGKAKNYIYNSVMTERQKILREQSAASRLNKYILIGCHHQ